MNTERITAFIANLRAPQMLFHFGALALGISLSTTFAAGSAATQVSALDVVLAFIAVLAAWITAVLTNDFFDQTIDGRSNAERPLTRGIFQPQAFVYLAIVFFVISVASAAMIHQTVFALIGLYHVLVFFYNVPPLRLKRVPVLGTFLIALSLQLIVWVGFAITQQGFSLGAYPLSQENIFLSLFLLSLFFSLKDLKDVEGDRMDGVVTLPIIFGRRTTRLIAAAGFSGFFFLAAIEHGGTNFLWLPLTASVLTFVLFCVRRLSFVTDRTVLWWAMVPALYFGLALRAMIF